MHRIPSAIVIDDDRETVSAFCEYLKAIDVNVWGFGYNGKDAAELYESLGPDVVFLDLLMPDYDGFYALEKIRQMDPDANVLVITADHVDERNKKRLEQMNPTGILQKPFDVERIEGFMDRFRK